jgi:hypothetical protein
MHYYADNTLSKYTTRLQKDIALTGDWEIGLSEISFSKTWFNVIDQKEPAMVIRCNECRNARGHGSAAQRIGGDMLEFPILLQIGHYETVDALLEHINESIRNRLSSFRDRFGPPGSSHPTVQILSEATFPVITYNLLTKRASVFVHKMFAVTLTEHMSRLLGFGKKQNPLTASAKEESSVIVARRPIDMQIGLQHVHVYTDVAEDIPVGDTCAPLLRIVNAEGKHGHVIHRVYDRPRYIPVQKKHFDSISIHIYDDLGKPVLFEYGKVITVVHLRQAKQGYFTQ